MFKIVFFAALREQLNCSEMSLDCEGIDTVADVKQLLAKKEIHWQQIFTQGSLLSAVNQEMVTNDHVVKSGDEIAFFPPVTGG